MKEKVRQFVSILTAKVSGFVERQTQPEELRTVLANLEHIHETERGYWAEKSFYHFVAVLHDIREPERVLRYLRMAGVLKEKFSLKWDNGEGASLENRRRQFLETGTIYKMPPEGLALLVYIGEETDQKMRPFVKQEIAKIEIDWADYLVNNLMSSDKQEFPVTHSGGKDDDQNGFNPFDPKTWRNPKK